MHSPLNQFRKKLAGHSSNKGTPLGRQAAKNAFSKSISPVPGQQGVLKVDQKSGVSPIRPQTLEFGASVASDYEHDPDVHKDI